jgi:hypothetical protein
VLHILELEPLHLHSDKTSDGSILTYGIKHASQQRGRIVGDPGR